MKDCIHERENNIAAKQHTKIDSKGHRQWDTDDGTQTMGHRRWNTDDGTQTMGNEGERMKREQPGEEKVCAIHLPQIQVYIEEQ